MSTLPIPPAEEVEEMVRLLRGPVPSYEVWNARCQSAADLLLALERDRTKVRILADEHRRSKQSIYEAEAEQLTRPYRLDAERYRWLRSHPVFQVKELPNEGELLDACIDRYMAGRETEA